jgi:hypothetical protein
MSDELTDFFGDELSDNAMAGFIPMTLPLRLA